MIDNRILVRRLARREIDAKFRGSQLGGLWYVVMPLLLMLVYTFVFGVIFKTRWPQQLTGDTRIVSLYLFSGLMIFGVMAEMIGRAPSLVLENAAYVKKVVFPLEVLPWVALAGALATFGASIIVFMLLYLVLAGLPPPTALLMPLLLAPFFMITLGVTWFLASLGVFVRDIKHFVGAVVTVLMFLAPIFFPRTAVPEAYRWLLDLNPVTLPVDMSKQLLFDGVLPAASAWASYTIIAFAVLWLGFSWFMRTKKAFADVV